MPASKGSNQSVVLEQWMVNAMTNTVFWQHCYFPLIVPLNNSFSKYLADEYPEGCMAVAKFVSQVSSGKAKEKNN